jgi:hypothetical protein
MAKMQSVSMQVNNPGRSAREDLNLTVGGTIVLTPQEVAKLVPGQLLRIPRIPATQSMGRLPLNPHEACHPVYGKPATQSTARLPPTPGEACHHRSAATLGSIFLV